MLTQVLNPVLMFMEPPTTVEDANAGKFERNTYFFLRNGLTTIASLVYSYYNLRYTYRLQKVLNNHKVLKDTCRTKVIL